MTDLQNLNSGGTMNSKGMDLGFRGETLPYRGLSYSCTCVYDIA